MSLRIAYLLIGVVFLLAGFAFALPRRTIERPMLSITSTAFAENASIPRTYTCDGRRVNPPLSISGVPAAAKSLALIMDDPDIPESVKERLGADAFDHWVVFDIPPDTKEIPENSVPGIEGAASNGTAAYASPCPPDREHRYFFRLYALDGMLPLGKGASRADVEKAMEGHVLGTAQLIGRYDRQ